jgi:hypothetical protein
VVIRYFHVVGVSFTPHETDPILKVDPDAVLAGPVALKGLQVVARRAEIGKATGGGELEQTPDCGFLYRPEFSRPGSEEDLFRFRTRKLRITILLYIVKR